MANKNEPLAGEAESAQPDVEHLELIQSMNNQGGKFEDAALAFNKAVSTPPVASAPEFLVCAKCEGKGTYENDGIERTCKVCDGDPKITQQYVSDLASQVDHYSRVAMNLRWAILRFQGQAGKHDGDHAFCCANNGRCLKCEESYIAAESRLDSDLKTCAAALSPAQAAPPADTEWNENITSEPVPPDRCSYEWGELLDPHFCGLPIGHSGSHICKDYAPDDSECGTTHPAEPAAQAVAGEPPAIIYDEMDPCCFSDQPCEKHREAAAPAAAPPADPDKQRLVNLLMDYQIEARNVDEELVKDCMRILGLDTPQCTGPFSDGKTCPVCNPPAPFSPPSASAEQP